MHLRLTSTAAVAAAWLFAAVCGAADAEPPPFRVIYRGALTLPETTTDQDGNEVRITGLSGITWLGESRYAAIMDNSNLLVLFELELSPAGDPVAVTDVRARTLSERHDYEDVAPCPTPLIERIAERRRRQGHEPPARCLLVVEETTPAIRGVSLDDGELLGVIPIPQQLTAPRPNRALESLAVDPDCSRIWTANEEALPADGPAATAAAGTVVRLTRIGVPKVAGGAQEETRQFAYSVEPPHPFVRVFNGDPLSGVVALVSLGDGQLLVLERSAGPGLPPFKNRIYHVDTRSAHDVSGVDRDLAGRAGDAVTKTLLWQDKLGRNFEGLCLGPELGRGRRALVAISDNGGTTLPNQLMTLVLELPVETSAIPTFTIIAAALALIPGLMIYRLLR